VDAFIDLVHRLLTKQGVPSTSIFRSSRIDLPGFFRPDKRWDIVIVHRGTLIACAEFKSQVGSFGNNYNNRIEEAIGNAQDIRTAYREGAFASSPSPWVGFFMVLQESSGSLAPVRVAESHFPVFEEFRSASYAKRYEESLRRLVRERLYDRACLLLTGGPDSYREPCVELSAKRFAVSLLSHWMASKEAE